MVICGSPRCGQCLACERENGDRLAGHVTALLDLIDRVGGYHSPEDQLIIRDAFAALVDLEYVGDSGQDWRNRTPEEIAAQTQLVEAAEARGRRT